MEYIVLMSLLIPLGALFSFADRYLSVRETDRRRRR